MKKLILGLCAAGLLSMGSVAVQAEPTENLRIIDKETVFTVNTAEGPVEITRQMTPCAKNKGWLQPLVPVEGAHPVSEIEVLEALNDPSFAVIDMRTVEWRVEATIPGSIHIPYIEVADRLDELGCKKESAGWNCAEAVKIVGFCNGPVCPQSPQAMIAMVRNGFPADKIYYYRGGMMAWDALGLTTVEGDF